MMSEFYGINMNQINKSEYYDADGWNLYMYLIALVVLIVHCTFNERQKSAYAISKPTSRLIS